MAEFVEKLILDDTEFISGLENAGKKASELGGKLDKMNKDIKTGTEQKTKSVVDGQKQVDEAIKKTVETQNKQIASVKNSIANYKVLGISLNDIKAKYNEYLDKLKGSIAVVTSLGKSTEQMANSKTIAGRAMVGLSRAANVLKGALIATGIGAFVVLLGSLVAFLTRTQKGIDLMAQASAAVGIVFAKLSDAAAKLGEKIFYAFENPKEAIKEFGQLIFDNIVNRFTALLDAVGAVGRGLVKLFQGEFKEAIEEAKNFGQAVVQGITGLDKEQQANFVKGFKELGTEIKAAAKSAIDLEKASQNLVKAKIKWIETEAKLNAELEKQRNVSRDISKSLNERIIAARKADQIENQLTAGRLKLAQEELRITKAQNSLAENINKDYEKEAQLAAQVSAIKAESSRKQIKLNQVENQLINEAIGNYNKLKEGIFDLAVELGMVSEAQQRAFGKEMQMEGLNEAKKILVDISQAIEANPELFPDTNLQEVLKQIQTIDVAIQKIGEGTKEDRLADSLKAEAEAIQAINTDLLISEQEKEYQKTNIRRLGEIERLQITNLFLDAEGAAFKENQIKISELQQDNILLYRDFMLDKLKEQQALEILSVQNSESNEEKRQKAIEVIQIKGQIKQLQLMNEYLDQSSEAYFNNLIKINELSSKINIIPGNWWDDVNNFNDLWEKFLNDTFGAYVGGKIAEFGKGLSLFVGEFGNLLNESTDIQLNNIDKQLDRLNKRRESLEDGLEKELELQSLGLANSADLKKTEVDNLLAEEARLNAEKEKLQQQAQKRQIISDAAVQASSLVTSSIQIYKGFAALGPFGIPLAIGAIAAMFGFFAKTKIDAIKATRLHTGARKIDDHFGFGARHGETDLPGKGSGYRLIRERDGHDTNVLISGREMLIPERISLQNEEFFTKLRLGWFNGIDLMDRMNVSSNISIPKSSGSNKIIMPTKAHREITRQFIKISETKYSLVTITPDMRDGTIIEIK
jgi:hypothetical protein